MAVEETIDDDPVNRIVDRAMEAQTRLMLTYLDNTRKQMRADVTRMIKEEFGGDHVYINKGSAGRNLQRDEAIRRDARPVAEGGLGLSLRALGKKYHLGKSRIAEVLSADTERSKA